MSQSNILIIPQIKSIFLSMEGSELEAHPCVFCCDISARSYKCVLKYRLRISYFRIISVVCYNADSQALGAAEV